MASYRYVRAEITANDDLVLDERQGFRMEPFQGIGFDDVRNFEMNVNFINVLVVF